MKFIEDLEAEQFLVILILSALIMATFLELVASWPASACCPL